MTVEKRVSTTAHGIKPPSQPGTPEFAEQLQDTITLCRESAIEDTVPWTAETLRILEKYSPVSTTRTIPQIMSDIGFENWKDVCDFVKYDDCPEFAVPMAKWAKKENFALREDRGFIDGQGIGFYQDYLDELKVTLERAFDAKWFYQAKRPLQYLYESTSGVDFSKIASYVHPAHNSYPAGHGTKFYTVVSTLLRWYYVPKHKRAELIKAAYVTAMGRSGILVHYPEDNLASGALVDGLWEFNRWKQG